MNITRHGYPPAQSSSPNHTRSVPLKANNEPPINNQGHETNVRHTLTAHKSYKKMGNKSVHTGRQGMPAPEDQGRCENDGQREVNMSTRLTDTGYQMSVAVAARSERVAGIFVDTLWTTLLKHRMIVAQTDTNRKNDERRLWDRWQCGVHRQVCHFIAVDGTGRPGPAYYGATRKTAPRPQTGKPESHNKSASKTHTTPQHSLTDRMNTHLQPDWPHIAAAELYFYPLLVTKLKTILAHCRKPTGVPLFVRYLWVSDVTAWFESPRQRRETEKRAGVG